MIQVRKSTFAALCLPAAVAGFGALAHADNGGQTLPAAYTELLQQSMQDKAGLEFYVNGQIIPGIVTSISDDGAVVVRNQSRDRIVIRLDRIDAVGR